jgi:hypothetical protein
MMHDASNHGVYMQVLWTVGRVGQLTDPSTAIAASLLPCPTTRPVASQWVLKSASVTLRLDASLTLAPTVTGE